MCSVVFLIRPGHAWPVLVATNRDEMRDRPWKAPARHWPEDHPHVIAGLDELAGGTWFGMNDDGVIAGVLNRVDSLGPQEGFRSRGELPLEALSHADAKDAAEALSHLDGTAYRSFNLFVADNTGAFWLRSEGEGPIDMKKIPDGVSMLTARDLNDESSPRIQTYLPRFLMAPVPDPDMEDWDAWRLLMASRNTGGFEEAGAGMTIESESGFGTVCSSLVGLPSAEKETRPVWLFCPAPPDKAEFVPVKFD